MGTKRPSFPFYPGDWLRDPAVRSVSHAARGLWIDMLCLMHQSDRRGYLQLNGKPVSLEQLARMTGCSTEQVSPLLQELETSGVFSCTEHGVIYNRRMVSDEHKRQLCVEAGKRGGNPTLKGLDKGEVKGRDKPPPEEETLSLSNSKTSNPAQGESESSIRGESEGGATLNPTVKGQEHDEDELSAVIRVYRRWFPYYELTISQQEELLARMPDLERADKAIKHASVNGVKPWRVTTMVEIYDNRDWERKVKQNGTNRKDAGSATPIAGKYDDESE